MIIYIEVEADDYKETPMGFPAIDEFFKKLADPDDITVRAITVSKYTNTFSNYLNADFPNFEKQLLEEQNGLTK